MGEERDGYCQLIEWCQFIGQLHHHSRQQSGRLQWTLQWTLHTPCTRASLNKTQMQKKSHNCFGQFAAVSTKNRLRVSARFSCPMDNVQPGRQLSQSDGNVAIVCSLNFAPPASTTPSSASASWSTPSSPSSSAARVPYLRFKHCQVVVVLLLRSAGW